MIVGNLVFMIDHDAQRTLMELERKGWDSLCDSTGDVFYGELMTDDAVMILANGEIMDRASVVAALGQAPPWRTYDISDARFVDTGSDSVALVYVGSAYREAAEPAFVGLMASVYVRRNGGWRLALYQQSPRPADKS